MKEKHYQDGDPATRLCAKREKRKMEKKTKRRAQTNSNYCVPRNRYMKKNKEKKEDKKQNDGHKPTATIACPQSEKERDTYILRNRFKKKRKEQKKTK
jgi:hypothetical protein